MSRHTLTLALASLLPIATTAVAHAQPAAEPAVVEHADDAPGWRVDLAVGTRWLRDPSAAPITTDTLSSVVWSAERRLATLELPRGLTLELAATADFGSGSATGKMFQTLDTTVGTIDLVGGVHATARMYRVLALSARAGVGATRDDLQIAPSGYPQMASVDDHGWGHVETASLGAEIEPLALPSIRLGFGAELGYVATSAVTMHAYPSDRGNPDLTIETAYASIGHLDLGGWSLRIGGHVSF